LQEAETVLARLQASGAETARERAFLAQYWGFVDQGYATRRQRLQESLSFYQARGDTWGVASSQSGLGWMAWTGGEYEEAERRFRESMASFAALGDGLSLARVRTMLSLLNKHLGRMDAAEKLLRQSLQSARDLRHRAMEADLLTALAMARRDQGRFAEGIAYVEESVAIWSDLGHLAEVASAETAQAQLLVHLGRHKKARALLAHARPLFGAPTIWSGANLMTTGMIALVEGNYAGAMAFRKRRCSFLRRSATCARKGKRWRT
jgi:tetratricopeptide (TPR) repeat protein